MMDRVEKIKDGEAPIPVNMYKRSWLEKNKIGFEDEICRDCRHNNSPPVWCKRFCSMFPKIVNPIKER